MSPRLLARPSVAVAIGWPECQRSTSRIAEMLNQFERKELDVIDSAQPSVRRPHGARTLVLGNSNIVTIDLCVHSHSPLRSG
jgi:hypothetical protein